MKITNKNLSRGREACGLRRRWNFRVIVAIMYIKIHRKVTTFHESTMENHFKGVNYLNKIRSPVHPTSSFRNNRNTMLRSHSPIATAAILFAALLALSLQNPIGLFAHASTNNVVDEDANHLAERMALHYTEQLNIIVELLDRPIGSITKSDIEDVLNKGQAAFDEALEAFPDDTLPHAHALFAKLCVKIGRYEQSLELFDEAIRRASIPLNTDDDIEDGTNDTTTTSKLNKQPQHNPQEIAEAEALAKQLILERNRSHFTFLQNQINAWDVANNALYGGGIPPETSPLDPLQIVELQLEVFPNPHPQSLFDKATFMVLLLDSPPKKLYDDETESDEPVNVTASAWEAYETYSRAQTWAFGAYLHGKKRGLAGGKPCEGKESGFGLAVGGTAWSNVALESTTFAGDEDGDEGALYMGTITLQNVLVSGKDAVLSGYGGNCQVYLPHRYVSLVDNIPMVNSWETPIHEISQGDSPFWSTHIPGNDYSAFNGKIEKDMMGSDVLAIPDPKPRSVKNGYDSAVLLSGYASDNYYHFVSEVLPSLVLMKDRVKESLASTNTNSQGKAKDIVIVPNLQHEFVEGFFRLMLPEAFVQDDDSSMVSRLLGRQEDKLSPHIVQWGSDKHPTDDGEEVVKYASHHPIVYARRLYAAAWDQPAEAPLGGPSHCLTPAALLRNMQQAVWKAVEKVKGKAKRSSKPTIVYCSRSSSPTRKLKEETELLARLEELASTMNAELVMFEKKSTDANSTSSASPTPLEFIAETVELFQSATVVVGVHGASLANIAFSRPDTTIVELGLEGLPQASHYRHVSNSLGLKHVDVFLSKDPRSLGATEVKLRKGGLEKVLNAVGSGLKQDGKASSVEDKSEL